MTIATGLFVRSFDFIKELPQTLEQKLLESKSHWKGRTTEEQLTLPLPNVIREGASGDSRELPASPAPLAGPMRREREQEESV